MLKWLHIKNLALVKEAALDFDSGFNAVTGETGAGKSVLMGGLRLLLGARFEKSAIREGADRCEIAGLFSVDPDSLEKINLILDDLLLQEGYKRSHCVRLTLYPLLEVLGLLKELLG